MFIPVLLEKFQRPTITRILVERLHIDSQMDIARSLLKKHKPGDRSSGGRLGWFASFPRQSVLEPAAHEAERGTVWTDTVKRGPHTLPCAGIRVPDTDPGVYTSSFHGDRCDRRPDSQAARFSSASGDDSRGMSTPKSNGQHWTPDRSSGWWKLNVGVRG